MTDKEEQAYKEVITSLRNVMNMQKACMSLMIGRFSEALSGVTNSLKFQTAPHVKTCDCPTCTVASNAERVLNDYCYNLKEEDDGM